MSKQTPFFKFDAMQWLGGAIQNCTLEEKGLFIDLCALYWKDYKPVKMDAKFNVRYRNLQGTLSNLIGTLSDLDFIVVSEAEITIPFLDTLMNDRQEFLEKCSKAGKKSASIKGTSSNKKEERRKKKEESRDKKEDKYTPRFEEAWKAYELKGSKKLSFNQWQKITEEGKVNAIKAIPLYLTEQPEKKFRKDFERYISQRVFEGVLERQEAGQLANQPKQDDRENRYYGL